MAGNAVAAPPAQATTAAALNPKVAPGGNFNLSVWELQLPIGSASPTTILPPRSSKAPKDSRTSTSSPTPPTAGCPSGIPRTGSPRPNSNYARSELRNENTNGRRPTGSSGTTNKLSATLKVTQVPDHVCVWTDPSRLRRLDQAAARTVLLRQRQHRDGDRADARGRQRSPAPGRQCEARHELELHDRPERQHDQPDPQRRRDQDLDRVLDLQRIRRSYFKAATTTSRREAAPPWERNSSSTP